MRISDWSSDVCSSDLHSFSRGLNVARLQGRVRASSWARMIFSHAVRQADVEPGRQNTNVPLASPANARDCSDEVPISSKLIARNSSPKPGISLYGSGPKLGRGSWRESGGQEG